MKGTAMYPEPRVMRFANRHGHLRAVVCVGETNRSWLSGEKEWERERISKAEYRPITESEYQEYVWAARNAYRIAELTREVWRENPATLRKIADLIGYEG